VYAVVFKLLFFLALLFPPVSNVIRVGAFGVHPGAWAEEQMSCYPDVAMRDTYHTGQDYVAAAGETVYAVDSGVVIYIYNGNYPGDGLIIEHDGFYSVYGHLDQISVEQGQFVIKGQEIADLYDWGGGLAHLHFELRDFAQQDLCDRGGWLGPGYVPTADVCEYGYYNPETFNAVLARWAPFLLRC
jgi:murein DD-endopeptidase MepM/ murein hydrolase activator NlpD